MRNENQFIKIFVTTDNHLGYRYEDKIQKNDSFTNFEEALQIAKKEKVDFVFFLGDLFDVPKPNYECIDQTLEILDKTIGKKSEFGYFYDCEQAQKYKLNSHSIPALLIHGNHDRPHNQAIFEIKYKNKNIRGCLDLLERFQVVKYIGRQVDSKILLIEPFIIKKQNIKIAVYALGYVQDKILNQCMKNNTITFDQMGDFDHHILIVHQNRLQGNQRKDVKQHLQLNLLNKYDFNLILWGHEHEAFKKLEKFNEYQFKIYQPGSTIATSLRQSEAIQKSVGILKFYKDDFYLDVIDLKKPRQMLLLDVDIEQVRQKLNQELNTFEEQIIDYIVKKLKLSKVKDSQLPLVRIKLTCGSGLDISKYLLDYQLKDFIANKKNAIVLRKKQIQPHMREEDFLETVQNKQYFHYPKNLGHCDKIKDKFVTSNIESQILDENFYFQILKSEQNQGEMIEKFMDKPFDMIQTEIQETKNKLIYQQQYLHQDLDELLDSQEKLNDFCQQLEKDINQTEFIEQETIELTHKLFNKKKALCSNDKEINETKIQLKTDKYIQFQPEQKNSEKQIKRSKKKFGNYFNQIYK